MSVWTHVNITMKFPEPVTAEELEKNFGKQLDLQFVSSNGYYKRVEGGWEFDDEAYHDACDKADEHNEREWAAYKDHESEYLPTGSEGSLQYVQCRRVARKTKDGKYKYEIVGSLRDYADDDNIVKWFRDKFLGFTLKHDDWTFKTYAKVSASMGVGELIWEYGKYDE